MNPELLSGKVTGEVLRAYDQLIKDWVTDQIRSIEIASGSVTEDRVNELIQEALSTFDGGSVNIPSWVSQVIPVDSTNALANANDVNALVWPGQDFSSKTDHFSTVFLGGTNGIRFLTRKPGDTTGTELTITLSNQPAIIVVAYDESGALVTVYTFGFRHRFRSLDSEQGYFEYDSADSLYYVNYQSLPTSSSVQAMINASMANTVTEERVQEMIDSSIGSAIADSY